MTTGSSKWNLFFQTWAGANHPKLTKDVRASAEMNFFLQGFLSFLIQIHHVGNLDGSFIL